MSTTCSDTGPERAGGSTEPEIEGASGNLEHVAPGPRPFTHVAALYAGIGAFLDVTVPFIRQALDASEPILVAVSANKIRMLRDALGADSEGVRFADMSVIGANPARIIPAWFRFVGERPSPETCVWGVGEPIGPERSAEALVECQQHESLLNVAFSGTPLFNLLCPYDTEALDHSVIEEAHRSHPLISRDGLSAESQIYRSVAQAASPCAIPLDPAPVAAAEMAFEGQSSLPAVRRFVEDQARAAGMPDLSDLTLVANELVANSLIHGGGSGVIRIWPRDGSLICEVSDHGRIDAPLAGRRPPAPGQYGGWGLWLANQLCELVQVRSFDHGSTVRVHVRP